MRGLLGNLHRYRDIRHRHAAIEIVNTMIDQKLGDLLDRVTAYYQPIVDLNTGSVAGFEALARVVDADGTAHSMGPVIEQIESDPILLERLMQKLLAAIHREAVPLLVRYPAFYVSVNVPPALLGNGKMAAKLKEIDLLPYFDRFVCEVTERQALTEEGRAALEIARKNRIRVAVDDFGTGHSGLAQLLGLTVFALKMDRSEVLMLTKNEAADRLVRGIVAFAGMIRARVVAEGVETAAQAFFLRAAGVDCGQGWFWSAALPATEMPKVIESGFPNWHNDLLERLNGTGAGSRGRSRRHLGQVSQ